MGIHRFAVRFLRWLGLPLLLAAVFAAGAGPASAERIERTIRVGGMDREYIAYIPPAARRAPLPVIFAFHPGLSSDSGFERLTKLHQAPGAENFIIVYPNGYRRTWNAGDCCGKAHAANIDDVGFVRAIFDDLSQYARIHPTRNFATGYSNGGNMAHEAACRISDRIAAVAVSASSHNFDRPCPARRPISVMVIHGTEDEVTPYQGGVSNIPGEGQRKSVAHVIDFWTRHNRCGRAQPVTRLGSVRCEAYQGCAGGSEVILCPVSGMGHVWPGARVGLLGRSFLGSSRVDLPGSAAVLQFFSSVR